MKQRPEKSLELAGRGEFMRVDPALVKIEATALLREESDSDLEALKASIAWRERRMKGSGLLVPLLVSRIEGVDYFRLEDGFRRFRAVQALIVEGLDIPTVPVRVLPAPLTVSERLMLMTHGPKPLGLMEEAKIIVRLEHQGLSFEAMARLLDRPVELLKKRAVLGKLQGPLAQALQEGRLQAEEMEFLLGTDEPLDMQQSRLEKELGALLLDRKGLKKTPKTMAAVLGAQDVRKSKISTGWMPKVLDPTLHYVALEGLYEWIGGEDAVKNGYSKKTVDIVKLMLKYCGGTIGLPETAEKLKKI